MIIKEFYDLDYESVKLRLRAYLSEFSVLKDYNFEGGAISTWINFASYIIVYISSILNFASNEMFIKTAQLEENVLKSAYQLNYLPRRKSAAKIELRVRNNHSLPVFIPTHSSFTMGNIIVTTLEDYTIPAFSLGIITAYEGEWVIYDHIYKGLDFEFFYLADRENVDWRFYDLYVNSVRWLSVYEDHNYYLSNNYFIRYFENFEIRFDKKDGFFNVPNVGDLVEVKYLKTSGAIVNDLTFDKELKINEDFLESQYLVVTTTDLLKEGLDEESLDSISMKAPLFYSASGRTVIEDDFLYKIQNMPLYQNISDMVVYSSHKDIVTLDEFPTEIVDKYSKKDKGWYVYTGVKRVVDEELAVTYDFLTAEEKQQVKEYFQPFKFMQVFDKYKEPNIFHILPSIRIKLLRDFDIDKEAIEIAIHEYLETFIGFNAKFNTSELISFIKGFESVDYCFASYRKFVSFKKPLILTIVEDATGFEIGDFVYQPLGVYNAHGLIVDMDKHKGLIVIERFNEHNFIPTGELFLDGGMLSSTIEKMFNKAVIRLGTEIVPDSIHGSIPGYSIADDGNGLIFNDLDEIGTVNYETGYIEIEDVFPFAGYNVFELELELEEDIAIAFERETFLDHKRAIIEYID